MNEIVNKETMTSLEIAEVTGKRHSDVLEAIRKMEAAWEKVSQRKFPLSSYKQEQPNGGYKDVPCYILNKTECLYVATKFNDEARAKLVLRWEELETKEREKYQVPQSFAEALMLAAKQQERIEKQAHQLEENSKEIIALNGAVAEMKPKVTYVDMILSSKETVTTTQIAQDYGMSATKFNILLRNYGIQHKVGGQWILYAQYLPSGYVQSKTWPITHKDGSIGTRMYSEWTQKGRLFLYEELKKRGVLPLIEQKQGNNA